MQHQIDHRKMNHRLAAVGQRLVIFAVPPVTAQPAKRSFHDPTFGQDLEPLHVVGSFDDLQAPPTSQGLNPQNQLAGVAAVSPDQSQPAPAAYQMLQHQFRPVTVLNVRRVDHHHQDQPQRIDDDVPLAPVDLLARVISPRPPFSVVLTGWLSITAAEGVGFLPAATRTFSRRRS